MKNKEAIASILLDAGMIPVYYHRDFAQCLSTLRASALGGLKVFEFTNRGEAAEANFVRLKERRDQDHADMLLGIGSILEPDTAIRYIELGADFIVAPILHEATAAACKERGINWIPGCGTLTEMVRGLELGAPLVKLFPGSHFGPGFVKAVLGPVPSLKVMPTGGVEPTDESLRAWFAAGVTAVGMGSQLFRSDLSEDELVARIRAALAVVNECRKKFL